MLIREIVGPIGRGPEPDHCFDAATAASLFDVVFGDGAVDLELGATLAALRLRGLCVQEVVAAMAALVPRLSTVAVDPGRPVVSIPSHNGTWRDANLVVLVACLLADAGVQVVIHGVATDPCRTTTAQVMRAMGLPCAGRSPAEAGDALARGDPAFVPVDRLSPRLAALLALRGRMGVSNVAHLLSRLINPTDSPACLRLVPVARPASRALVRDYFAHTGESVLVLCGREGEAVPDGSPADPIVWVHDGRCEPLPTTAAPRAPGAPVLPDARDAGATARWIQSVLAGERPVPASIDAEVGAVLHVLGCRPDAASYHR